MRISEWSSDVCSSDLAARPEQAAPISVAAMQALVQSMETKHGPSQENRLCVDGGDDRDDPDCGLRGAIAERRAGDLRPARRQRARRQFELAQDRKSTRLNSSH